MKRTPLVLLLTCWTFLQLVAQTPPQAFQYQGIARSSNGAELPNQAISVRFSILSGAPNGAVAYEEVHSALTNNIGLFNLQVGLGTPTNGSFSAISWGSDAHFLRVEIDPDGGSTYSLVGTTQLLSVPYALHAGTVANDQVDDADNDPTNERTDLVLNGNVLSLTNPASPGNEVVLPATGDDLGSHIATQNLDLGPNQLVGNGGANGISITSDGRVGIGTTTPDANALLDLNSSSQALLLPRLSTAQRDALSAPEPGLMIFNTTSNCLEVWSGIEWIRNCGELGLGGIPPAEFNNFSVFSEGGAGDETAYRIAIDNNEDLFVAGLFKGTLTLGATTLTSTGSNDDIFLAKYDGISGNVLWAVAFNGPQYVSILVGGLRTDDAGNVLLGGGYQGTVTIGSYSLTSNGSFDAFLLKCDGSNGNVLWATSMGGPQDERPFDLNVDGSGDVFVTGHYGNGATFGAFTLSVSGFQPDVFVVKCDGANGNVLWAQGVGGSQYDVGTAIMVDAGGDVYVTGNYSGTATFGSSTFNSAGSDDIFFLKCDGNSGAILWAQTGGGPSYDQGHGLDVDDQGNLILSGIVNAGAVFQSISVPNANNSAFIAQVDPSDGSVNWVERVNILDGAQIAKVCVAPSGIFLAGQGYGTIFGDISLTPKLPNGYFTYLAKLSPADGSLQWVVKADSAYPYDMACSGNFLAVTGHFYGLGFFGTDQLSSNGGRDFFVWILQF